MVVLLLAAMHFAALQLLADAHERISSLLVRAQLTKWPLPARNPPPRIERDDMGRIVALRLNGVKLAAGDIDIVLSLRQLQRLSLDFTTISDHELARLADLPNLEGLTLNLTSIGDAGVASLARFPKLKSVCMFRVNASPEAIRALKRERKHISIGYVPLGK